MFPTLNVMSKLWMSKISGVHVDHLLRVLGGLL